MLESCSLIRNIVPSSVQNKRLADSHLGVLLKCHFLKMTFPGHSIWGSTIYFTEIIIRNYHPLMCWLVCFWYCQSDCKLHEGRKFTCLLLYDECLSLSKELIKFFTSEWINISLKQHMKYLSIIRPQLKQLFSSFG